MANVVLPCSDEEAIKFAQQTADKRHNVYFIYGKIKYTGGGFDNITTDDGFVFFTRISAQVYVEFAHFTILGDLIPKLLDEYQSQGQPR